MNIKSLLLGSAAATVALTGAQAADAIVIAEPEPVEYVRVCDVYGAGFFFIPGTETCLRIGGLIRYEMHYNNIDWIDGDGVLHDYRFGKFSRFQLNVDARSETEWGTLRGYAEGRWNWNSTDGLIGPGGGAVLNQAFIEVQAGGGTVRIGKSDLPYARFLGYGSTLGPYDGDYGFRNSGELSYTFNNGSGFSAIVAVTERGTGLFEPAVEAGVNFTQGWGSIGGIVAYDSAAEEWSAKAVARGSFGAFGLGAHIFYSSDPNAYTVGLGQGLGSEWSALVHANVDVSQTLAVHASVQWFDTEFSAVTDDVWQISGGLDWRPVTGLRIRPEVRYTTEVETWEAAIRFDRSF